MKYAILLLVLAAAIIAQPAAPPRPDLNAEPETIPLWEGGAPGGLGDSDADRPTITSFAPPASRTEQQSSSRPAEDIPRWR